MSWNWKAICKIKDEFKNGYVNGNWLAEKGGYTIRSGYDWIRYKEHKVGWAKLLWKSWAIPKHKFLSWLILRNAINVKAKLYKHGVCQDEICYLCNTGQETIEHVFQSCEYASLVMVGVCDSLHIPIPTVNGIIWIGRRQWSSLKKRICLAAVMAVYYAVWQPLNQARMDGILLTPSVLVQQIQQILKSRMLSCKVVANVDVNWMSTIM
ncbi:uncharacterized protein LOC141601743 [Silene latifolia]|uniref:uncharacterized protein LOC141601743 n=1 Tax=Silene latifolia TaxID=37657 RepID=UPI003D77DD08